MASQENSVQRVINPLWACRETELCIHNTHMPFPPLSYAKRIPLLSECGLGKCLWKCDKQLGTRHLLFYFSFCCRGRPHLRNYSRQQAACLPLPASLLLSSSQTAAHGSNDIGEYNCFPLKYRRELAFRKISILKSHQSASVINTSLIDFLN